MAVVTTNLGAVTAYGDAVAAGYTGTKEQWQALMADYATVGQQASQSAQTASTAATTATTAAQTATTKAGEASASAEAAAESAAAIGTPDTTLTQSGKAADAKVTGDKISEIKEDFTDLEAFVNLSSGKLKNIPMSRSGTASDLSVVYKFGKVTLNGTIANNNVVLEADSDITAVKEGIPYRQGINSGLISDNASARKIPITAGRYRVVFNMLSGSVTKGGVTYTDNDDFGTANVVNAFLLKPDASTESYTLVKTNVTTEVDLSVTQFGLQVLYCYSGCTFTNAVFELYLEKVG